MKKKKSKLRYRMYGLVPDNISPIQQGIQFGHAVVEYGLNYGDTAEYKEWARNHKTFIILNGGTTSTNPKNPGTLNQHASTLRMKVGVKKTAVFYEPDLGDQLTAVAFLVDERVWDKELYPDPDSEKIDSPFGDDWTVSYTQKELSKILKMRGFLSQFRLA
jgi:hypothetical protein